MILKHERNTISDFNGTVIDLETIGHFNSQYSDNERRLSQIQPILFGYLTNAKLTIVYIEEEKDYPLFLDKIKTIILPSLIKPLYAFNCGFEHWVLLNQLKEKVEFTGELQNFRYEKKLDVVHSLKLDNYDDPFFDNGLKCEPAWKLHNYKQVIAHNRACLLKERDILIQRGYRNADYY